MPTENPTHISDFDINKPIGASELANLSDDYLRDIKRVLKTDFAQINAVVTASSAQLNYCNVSTLGTAQANKAVTSDTNRTTKSFRAGTSLRVVDETNETIQLLFDLSGGTASATMTLLSSQTANRVLTLPDATDTLVARDTTDTLTNKTLTSAELDTGVSGSAVDTDGTLAADSDSLLVSQKAVKTYVDSATGTLGSLVSTTSGTSHNILSSIATPERITVMFRGVSFIGTAGVDDFELQVGHSNGTYLTTGYLSAATSAVASSNSTTGLLLNRSNMQGLYQMTGIAHLEHMGDNVWVIQGAWGDQAVPNIAAYTFVGEIDMGLSNPLTDLRIIRKGSTSTFDGGTIRARYK